MNKKQIVTFLLPVLIVVIPVAALAFFLYRDIAPRGTLFVSQDLSGPKPSISVLFPEGRLTEPQALADRRLAQIVKDEPLYFDVRMPRTMQQVTVRVYYTGGPERLGIGMRLPPKPNGEDWHYVIHQTDSFTNKEGVRIAAKTFAIKDAGLVDRKARFILSLPPLVNGESPMRIERVTAQLTGEALTWQRFFEALLTKVK